MKIFSVVVIVLLVLPRALVLRYHKSRWFFSSASRPINEPRMQDGWNCCYLYGERDTLPEDGQHIKMQSVIRKL